MAEIARRLQPRDGWGLLLLALLTGILLASAVAIAEWVSGSDLLIPTAVVALLVGRWTGRRSWRLITHTLFGLVSGLLVSIYLAAGGPQMLPEFMDQWQRWVLAAVWGGVTQDPTIFLLYTLLMMWATVFYAGWRGTRAFGGLADFLPSAALSAVSVFYSERGALPLFTGVFCWLLMVGLGNLVGRKEIWESRRIDYATDLEFDIVLAAGLIALVLVLVGAFLPALSVEGFVRWVNETFSRPAEMVEIEARRLFSGVRPPQREGYAIGSSGADIPSLVHPITGSPDLGTEEVFRVLGDDVSLPYWRGATYDLYTGGEWQITVDAEEDITGSLWVNNPPQSQIVMQRISHAREGGGGVYAMGDVVRVEGGDTTVLWRGLSDPAGLLVSSTLYTVTSVVAQPEPDELRTAATEYSIDTALFLQLPDGVPERVWDLAREVTEEATTPYDRAVRIEHFLRGYSYSLDVPPPPADRDIVDYFLFDLGEGYCDYYATAFVVMARMVGLPARLAIGYVGGQPGLSPWDRVVVEENSHSWPEVYFPDWGWVRFEPTAARAEVRQYLEEESGTALVERLPRRPMTVGRSIIWAAVILGLGMVFGVATWASQRRRAPIYGTGLPSTWRMLVHIGSLLGSAHQPGQTVFDYAEVLSEIVASWAATTRWRRRTWLARANQVKRMLDHFAVAYSRHLYGGGPEGQEPPAELLRELIRMRRVPLMPRRDH